MIYKAIGAGLVLAIVALLTPLRSQAETAKEWEDQIRVDSDGAMRTLWQAYGSARRDAMNYYFQHGHSEITAQVESFKPNEKELVGRAMVAATDRPNVSLEQVMKVYIIDVLKQFPAKSTSAPGR